MAPPMVELRGISKSFDGGRTHAVRGVDLVIGQGEFVALVGGSGSGKTTTLKMINGLVRPGTGEVRVSGEAAGAIAPHLLRRRIGYVFQEIGLFPHLTVAENIADHAKAHGRIQGRDRRARRRAARSGRPAARFRRAAARPRLSGGQRQRVGRRARARRQAQRSC